MPLRLFSVLHDRECLLCPRPHCAIVFLHLPAQLKRCAFKFLLCPQHFHFASNCHKVTGHVVERFFYFLQNFTISLWAQSCKRIGCPCSFCTWAISEFLWSLERFSDRLHLFFFQNDFFSRESRVSVTLRDSIFCGGHIIFFLALAASLVVMSDVSLLAFARVLINISCLFCFPSTPSNSLNIEISSTRAFLSLLNTTCCCPHFKVQCE